MKFLDSKEISEEKGNVKVKFKPIQPEDQAVIAGYQGAIANAVKARDEGRNIQAQMRTVFYALKNMVNEVKVDNEIIDHEKAAECSDVSDIDTINVLLDIYHIVVSVIIIGETKKKSSTPQSPTKKVKDAKNVQGQKKA